MSGSGRTGGRSLHAVLPRSVSCMAQSTGPFRRSSVLSLALRNCSRPCRVCRVGRVQWPSCYYHHHHDRCEHLVGSAGIPRRHPVHVHKTQGEGRSSAFYKFGGLVYCRGLLARHRPGALGLTTLSLLLNSN